MKYQYLSKRLRSDTLDVIHQADTIIKDFQLQGYRMTLRQLYYQFVSKNFIPNDEKSYKRLASIVSDGRLAGYLDWDAIEDRGRQPDVPWHYDDIDHMLKIIKNSAETYKLDSWKGQATYVELWVEKQALASVLEPLARKHHVTLMVNKGYSSQSAMYASAQRYREAMGTVGDIEVFDPEWHECTAREFRGTEWRNLESDRDGVLLYLGDHDPSGEDMVRDIRERMMMFGAHDITVQKIALTTAQVKKYNPPPNPAKLTDPRAKAYIQQHGHHSWELDALDPPILSAIVSSAIQSFIEPAIWKVAKDVEALDRAKLKTSLDAINLTPIIARTKKGK